MHYKHLYFAISIFCAGSVFAPVQSFAQSGQIESRVQRLENEIETLSRSVYRGERPPASASVGGASAQQRAQAEIRIQELESQIQRLTGKVEEQSYEIRTLKNQLERMSADINLRLSDLEGSSAGNGRAANKNAPTPPAKAPVRDMNSVYTPNSNTAYYNNPASAQPQNLAGVVTGTVPPSSFVVGKRSNGNDVAQTSQVLGTVNERADAQNKKIDGASAAYENAFSMLKNSNYESAEQGFSKFLQQYPKHVLASNAKYWLGETYYVRGDFEQSARIFAEGYQQYPNGSKAADNLLKLALSLASGGNKNDACIALGQLDKQFSDGAGPVLRRADQEKKRLGC